MTREVLLSDTLVVNGNPIQLYKYCYVTSDPIKAFEIFIKQEGSLRQLSFYLDSLDDEQKYHSILNYLKVRAAVGHKYPLIGITLHTSSKLIWERVGGSLKQAGYPIIWKAQ